jgi:hypothetical protein
MDIDENVVMAPSHERWSTKEEMRTRTARVRRDGGTRDPAEYIVYVAAKRPSTPCRGS